MARRFIAAGIFTALLVGVFSAAPLEFAVAPPASQQARPSGSNANFQTLADKAVRADRAGEPAEAIRLYGEALRIRPQWSEGWRSLGVLLDGQKDYTRAENAFKKFVQLEPKNGSGWALLGLTEFEKRDYDGALAHIANARRLGVSSPDLVRLAMFHEALLLIHKSDFEAAEPLLLSLVHGDVADPDLVTALGLDALRIPSLPDHVPPDEARLVSRVGEIDFHAFHGNVEQASAAYEQLISEQPTARGIHYAYGKMLATAGRFEPSIAEMQKELDLNPKDVMALLEIAMNELNLNQADLSVSYAEKAVDLAPALFAAHYALGRALDKLQQTDRAVKELEEAVKLAPSVPDIHFALFQAYSHANRKSDALRERKLFVKFQQESGALPPQ